MKKTLLFILLCTVLGFTADTADIATFFPLQKGFTWTYDTLDKRSNKHFDMKVEIQDSWKDGDDSGMIMKQKDGRGTMREFLLTKDGGIFIRKLGLSKFYTPEVFSNFTPSVPRVIAPLVPGTTVKWEGDLKSRGRGAQAHQVHRASGRLGRRNGSGGDLPLHQTFLRSVPR